ncbi:NAD(P)/FAD-dependent oxidoreductase [Streptomyces sp. NPDC047024]|uniref:NAD(P)/FAD-dependent oxidoreductase n=1 Tax=Streptomyces sp. NPDC047024 TaxID=3155476 RepID=UPI0033DCF504
MVTLTESFGNEYGNQDGYDVVVVGGGAAGLSAALVLGRARRRTLVVDAGEPRNAPSAHMHGYLSRDGMAPADFLAVGREEIARYGVELVRDRALTASRDTDPMPGAPDGFAVTLASGRTVHARHLVVATGLRDELPPLPGLAERFGRDVIHCPYCHGWESRDLPTGVLATSQLSAHQALMVTQWSGDVRLFLNEVPESDLAAEDRRRLAAAGVEVVPGEVTGLVVTDDRLTGVRLGDGTVHDRAVLYVAPRAVPRDELLTALGAEMRETPFGRYPVIDERGLTSVPGLWAAGNASGFAEQVVNAASRGYRAGATINGELLFADLDAKAADLDAKAAEPA